MGRNSREEQDHTISCDGEVLTTAELLSRKDEFKVVWQEPLEGLSKDLKTTEIYSVVHTLSIDGAIDSRREIEAHRGMLKRMKTMENLEAELLVDFLIINFAIIKRKEKLDTN